MRWPVIRPGDLVGVDVKAWGDDLQDAQSYSRLSLYIPNPINPYTGKPQESVSRWSPRSRTDQLQENDVLFVVAVSPADEENDLMAYVLSPRAIGWTWLDVGRQRMLEKLLHHEEKTN
jgi:hypothetical protein